MCFCISCHYFDNWRQTNIRGNGIKQPLISTLFLAYLDEMILERGGSPADLVAEAGLPPTVLAQDGSLIPFTLHAGLLDQVAEKLRWPTLALELGRRQSIGYLGPIYPLLCNANTVREGLDLLARHLSIQANLVKTWVDESDFIAEFHLKMNLSIIAESPRFQDHAVSLTQNLIHWLCGQSWQPRAIFFPRDEPEDITAYTQFFNAPVAFNSNKLSITFDSAYLDKPFQNELSSLPDQLRGDLESREILDASAQVSFIIQSILGITDCNINHVARALGYTKRTLQRNLNSEGTSFMSILDAVRINRAKIYLANDYYRLGDVAVMLGFADQACFNRSFRRWLGMTPSQWQKAQ